MYSSSKTRYSKETKRIPNVPMCDGVIHILNIRLENCAQIPYTETESQLASISCPKI